MSLARLQFFVKIFGILCFVFLITFSLTLLNLFKRSSMPNDVSSQTSRVLGIAIASLPTPTPVIVHALDGAHKQSDSSHISSLLSKPLGQPKKSQYVIAVYGDSFEDTMGDRLEILSSLLVKYYPSIHFNLYNYGIGAQNVEEGLSRFDAILTYKNRNYPPITAIKPDIIIVGSFAYNPFDPPDAQKHKTLLTQLVKRAKDTGAKVFLLAEVAPLGTDFGKGAHGMTAWTGDYRLSHAKEILDQMDNVFTVASDTNTPLIDVYDLTKSNGPFGSWEYTNGDDGIHPSVTGQTLTAQAILHSLF